jgi:hypothetical protein
MKRPLYPHLKDHRKERGTRGHVCDRHEYRLVQLAFLYKFTSADDVPTHEGDASSCPEIAVVGLGMECAE